MPRHQSKTVMLYIVSGRIVSLSDVQYLRPGKLIEMSRGYKSLPVYHQFSVGIWHLCFIPLPTLKRVEDVIQGRRKEHEIGSVKSSTLTVEINMRKKTELCEKLHTHHGLLSTGQSGQIAARDTVL
jgi:hypothetical protein